MLCDLSYQAVSVIEVHMMSLIFFLYQNPSLLLHFHFLLLRHTVFANDVSFQYVYRWCIVGGSFNKLDWPWIAHLRYSSEVTVEPLYRGPPDAAANETSRL